MDHHPAHDVWIHERLVEHRNALHGHGQRFHMMWQIIDLDLIYFKAGK